MLVLRPIQFQYDIPTLKKIVFHNYFFILFVLKNNSPIFFIRHKHRFLKNLTFAYPITEMNGNTLKWYRVTYFRFLHNFEAIMFYYYTSILVTTSHINLLNVYLALAAFVLQNNKAHLFHCTSFQSTLHEKYWFYYRIEWKWLKL